MASYKETNKYDDIIHLSRPYSGRHARMSMLNRAAQFSPFAALTGYEDAIAETGRLTQSRIEPGEDRAEELDAVLRGLLERIDERPPVRVTYFLPDERKEGGSYVTAAGRLLRMDRQSGILQLTDGTMVPLADIWEVSGEEGGTE